MRGLLHNTLIYLGTATLSGLLCACEPTADSSTDSTTAAAGSVSSVSVADVDSSASLAAPKSVSIQRAPGVFTVKWSPVDHASRYVIYRSDPSSSLSDTGVALGNVTCASDCQFADSSIVPLTVYQYRVHALTSAGIQGPGSAVVSAQAPSPLKTSGLLVSSVSSAFSLVAGDSKVKLTWKAAPGAARYVVHRGASSEALNELVTIPDPATLSYLDATVVNGLLYYYSVTAVDEDGTQIGDADVQSIMPNRSVK